jgi:hypothetical protein
MDELQLLQLSEDVLAPLACTLWPKQIHSGLALHGIRLA